MSDGQESRHTQPEGLTDSDSEDNELDLDAGNVEDQIASEYIFNVMEADVDVEIADVMNELLDEDDFGGEDLIVERIEEAVFNDEN